MFATGEAVGLVEWIIDDTCNVSTKFLLSFKLLLQGVIYNVQKIF